MLEKVRHNDRYEIVTLYTLQRGRVPLIVSSAATKGGRLKRAMLMPLSVVEVTVRMSAGSELQRPRTISALRQFPAIYSHPYKSAVGFFLRDFLSRLLRDYPAEPQMWRFLTRSLDMLDAADAGTTANYHLIFLATLTSPLGIRPDLSPEAVTPYFDLRAGTYVDTHPLHSDVLTGVDARIPLTLSKLNYHNGSRWRLSRQQRRNLLHALLHFYGLHFSGLDNLDSTDVLHTLFD